MLHGRSFGRDYEQETIKEFGSTTAPSEPEQVLLTDGVYWQSGDASDKTPHEGQGWILTTLLQDGLVGDTSTRVTSTGATISILNVQSAFDIATWNNVWKWNGSFTVSYWVWNVTVWAGLANSGLSPVDHEAYVDEAVNAVFGANTIVSGYHMAIVTASSVVGGNMSCSDERPSA